MVFTGIIALSKIARKTDQMCLALIFGIYVYPDVTFSNMAKNPGFPPNLCTEKSHILVTLMLFH